jgi:ribose 5-phosphate isomerase B
MKIALGTDHAGFAYKERIKELLLKAGHEVKDCGTYTPETCDYPIYVRPAAEAVSRGECDRAIVLGGSGNGEAIVANRVRGIRCVLAWSVDTVRLGRQHNDSNALAIGERLVSFDLVEQMLDVWFKTPFEGGRHVRRIQLIDAE